jgi:hypothetical protein
MVAYRSRGDVLVEEGGVLDDPLKIFFLLISGDDCSPISDDMGSTLGFARGLTDFWARDDRVWLGRFAEVTSVTQ